MFNLEKYPEQWVEISGIDVDGVEFQSRLERDQKKIKNLAEEFKKDGMLKSCILYKYNDSSKLLAIISGHHRIPAGVSIGMTKILARVIPQADMDDLTAQLLSTKENLNSDTLKSKDIIFACKRLADKGMLQAQVAKDLNIAESTVRKYLAAADSADAQAVADGTKSIASAIGKKKASKSMYYKPLGDNGFDLFIKFRGKRDDPQAFRGFIAKNVPEMNKLLDDAQNNAAAGGEKIDKAASRLAFKAAKLEFKTKKTKLKQIASAVKSAEKSAKDSEKTGIDSSALKQHLEELKKQHEALKTEVKELKGKLPKGKKAGKHQGSTENREKRIENRDGNGTANGVAVQQAAEAEKAKRDKAKLREQANPIIDGLTRKRQALVDKSDPDMEKVIMETGQSREGLIKMIDEQLGRYKQEFGE